MPIPAVELGTAFDTVGITGGVAASKGFAVEGESLWYAKGSCWGTRMGPLGGTLLALGIGFEGVAGGASDPPLFWNRIWFARSLI